MSLSSRGKPDEARQRALSTTEKIKHLPADEKNPLVNAAHDDLVT